MSSGSALAAAGSRGVGWQVDIPGLASLVFKLGASRLKRFAQAGVDLHTVVCMWEIAEKCPASIDYRREISACRQRQPKQSQWFYTAVELGSATNFVADELLKNRAGENVIALMSASLPVMSETSCDAMLLELFEAAGAPLDKTPGLGQLRSLRETLLPLARSTTFKDKVFQYHILAKRLLRGDAGIDNALTSLSVPSEKTTVEVILSLSALMQDPTLILDYHGLRGAAWVIAYARHVLGLPVCVLRSISKSVPISGDYQSARVLVHIYEGEGKFEILAQKQVRDYFVTESLDTASYDGWCVDVREINVLDSYMPTHSSRSAISIIMRTMANDTVERLVLGLNDSRRESSLVRGRSLEIVPYLVYCLPTIRKRAQKILELFGCEAEVDESSQLGTWKDFFSMQDGERDRDAGRFPANSEYLSRYYMVSGPAWKTTGLGAPCGASIGTFEIDQQRLDKDSQQRIAFLLKLVHAASWLAFTDWHENVRFLSITFLEKDIHWSSYYPFYCPFYGAPYILEEEWFHSRNRVEFFPDDLCKIVAIISIGGLREGEPSFKDKSLLCLEHKGIIFAQNATFRETLDFTACVLHLTSGIIVVHNEPRKAIHAASPDEKPKLKIEPPKCVQADNFSPVDLFSSISVTTRVVNSGKDLGLHQRAILNDAITTVRIPGDISSALLRTCVSLPCKHDYYREIKSTYETRPENSLTSTSVNPKARRLRQGICMEFEWGSTWLQAVD